jgi:hypothetical protein
MLVDVDYYTPTKYILDMLLTDDAHWLPRVQMFFDDISYGRGTVFQGELLAVKEFNLANEKIKISPEIWNSHERMEYILGAPNATKIKECHRFNHPKYNQNITRWTKNGAVPLL